MLAMGSGGQGDILCDQARLRPTRTQRRQGASKGQRRNKKFLAFSWGGWVWNLDREQSGFGSAQEEQRDQSPGTGTGEGPRGTGVSATADEA